MMGFLLGLKVYYVYEISFQTELVLLFVSNVGDYRIPINEGIILSK